MNKIIKIIIGAVKMKEINISLNLKAHSACRSVHFSSSTSNIFIAVLIFSMHSTRTCMFEYVHTHTHTHRHRHTPIHTHRHTQTLARALRDMGILTFSIVVVCSSVSSGFIQFQEDCYRSASLRCLSTESKFRKTLLIYTSPQDFISL